MNLKLYEQLTSMHGGSGNEFEIRKFMKENLVGAKEIIQDGLGGIFGVYGGSKDDVKIMICAHMDEISCMVTEITSKGFIKMMPIGGINVETFVSQNVIIKANNKEIKGVVSSIPPHISKDNKLTFDDLVVDIGCDSAVEVEELGIRIGSYITPVSNFYFTENKKKMVNKAFDDRLGCAMVLDLVQDVLKTEHPNTIILGGTVQEEVGLRGGQVSSTMIVPDLFITIDVSPVTDYLGGTDSLGGGFLVRYYDPRNIMPPKLVDYFTTLATKNNIPYQMFKSKGGTDAGIAQYAGKGILATTVGVPGRYIHSPATMVSINDIQAAHEFVLTLIKDFNKDVLDKLHE